MRRVIESSERAPVAVLGYELARKYDDRILIGALSKRLALDGRDSLQAFILRSVERESAGPWTRAVFFAQALIGRLRIEDRGDLADALVSLLSGESPEIDPVLWLNETHAFIATNRKLVEAYRARGLAARADEIADRMWVHFRVPLIQRLRADGAKDLAQTISTTCYAIEHPAWKEEPPKREPQGKDPRSLAACREPPPEIAALLSMIDALVHAHPADVLAYAAVARIRDEGREPLAASIMMFWAREMAGPLVDPAQLARELVDELRACGHDEPADSISALVSSASIGRDPCEIMALWLHELAGPMVDPRPLGVTLVAALRNERFEEIASRVEALLATSP
ncbi:hypothetical protein [Sorangium sp. So ce887]|uniref:hypothetical protein n=1 Tax=Sorangium sp. So ce887 TaxID=3133324 RepID=UPI003F60B9EF